MEGYLSIREAAEKWGVSERRINQYCTQGRIAGAEQFGGAWAIPENAKKPEDPRRRKKQLVVHKKPQKQKLFPDFMPLMNTPFEPGYCVQTIENMRPGPKKDIAPAEYHYFSGQAEKAMRETEGYLTAQDSAVRLSACWIFAYSCLTMGRIDHARRALQQIKNTLADGGKTSPAVRAMEAFVAFAAAVLLHLPLPEEMPPTQTFLPLLPPGVRAFALYVQAHYLYLKEQYAHSAGALSLSEGAICPQHRHRGSCPGNGRLRISHLRHLSAFGSGDELYEPAADRTGTVPSAAGVADCATRWTAWFECPFIDHKAKPQAPSTASALKVGDTVKVKQGAAPWNGGRLASWVYSSTFELMELSGERAVIGKGGAVTTAINVKNLVVQ